MNRTDSAAGGGSGSGRRLRGILSVPVRRPVATTMFYLALVIMGGIGLVRIPVELIPDLAGDYLYLNFFRPGSQPEVVEREILLPLAAKVSRLGGVEETEGSVRGSGGDMSIRFEKGVDLKVRELELRRLATELARAQPVGTRIEVNAMDLSTMSRFVMIVQVSGMSDRNALFDFVEDRITPRLEGVPGVSRVMATGGAPLEVTIRIDTDRCAALGVSPDRITATLARSVQRLRFLGGVEDGTQRVAVILDGRPGGIVSLADTRIDQARPVLLRHVAEIDYGAGEERSLYRVNGDSAIGLFIFKEESANLVRLGRALRARMDLLRDEYSTYGIDFSISVDGAEMIEDQLRRLVKLALSGFVIALLVLFLFLREWRAVSVVAVAVPVSLLSAMGLLYLGGQSLNIITLFGLAVAVGMLVDNSIVVYEAVQRALERGSNPDNAAVLGVRRTVRAIVAASATTAAVFVPLAFTDFADSMTRSMMTILALAILLPLAASLLVAIGLVPLLARRLAAPAAMARIERNRNRREALAGFAVPDRARELFGGALKTALRRPAWWLVGTAVAVIITVVVALPWVAFSTAAQEAPEADTVQMAVEMPAGTSLKGAVEIFESLEQVALDIDGVERVESTIQEDQEGVLMVHLVKGDDRPDHVNAAVVRAAIRKAVENKSGVDVRQPEMGGGGGRGGGGSAGGGSGVPGQEPTRVTLSGPDFRELITLAREIENRLRSIPEIGAVNMSSRPGRDEVHVFPRSEILSAYGLTADRILPVLGMVRREGVDMRIGITMQDGREIPLTVRRQGGDEQGFTRLQNLRVPTEAGVFPMVSLADVRRMPPPPVIRHHNGRREVEVEYALGFQAPQTGPARTALEERIQQAIQEVHRPAGYTVETTGGDDDLDWFRNILVPVLLLLLAILAITFESLTLPLLVMISLPLTLLGGTWALVLSGTPAGPFALAGALALIGLTVNPAILLVDRMQHRIRAVNATSGAAALAAVRERVRPVLMTATTTIAGLWPLALVTGQQNELWPPFAIVVMGGLATSTILTLLIIPIGFLLLRRLDDLFGRLGPWVMIGWSLAIVLVMTPLIQAGLIDSMTWKILTTVLVSALLLGLTVMLVPKPAKSLPDTSTGPPVLSIRYLGKIYGRPGPIGRAWRVWDRFAARVREWGGEIFDPADARAALVPVGMVLAGALYLAFFVQSLFWRMVCLYIAAGLFSRFVMEIRRARGKVDELGRVLPGGPEGIVSAFCPWLATIHIAFTTYILPHTAEAPNDLPLAFIIFLMLLVLFVHTGRRTAVKISRGEIRKRLDEGRLRRWRSLWRWLSRRVFGLDLPREEVRALTRATFRVERGMVGVLGPNGAGKTTLLRMLAGILEPSVGTISLGGVRLEKVRRFLARWVGYLPQEFGLPDDMTARGYLDYYARLYELPARERAERVSGLLKEVGLGERGDDKIGNYSGGMRQRVAVARTLLRLPPVIIVDEPTVGLDPRERIRFRNLLSRLAEGRIVLFSTHVVEDVAVACERVLVLTGGRIVFDGLPGNLAETANGKVWEVRLEQGEEEDLPAGALVVDQVPEPGDVVRTRILSEDRPHENAVVVEATLEDGYLLLAGEREREMSA